MSQWNEGPCRAFKAATTLAQFLRVIKNGTLDEVIVAGAADRDIGVMELPALAIGDSCTVRMRTTSGTQKMLAAGAITNGANVYGAAGGKVSATGNGNPIGIALHATGADGDVVEVLRDAASGSTAPVEAHTADDTLTAAESGSTHTNTGAAGTITQSLPAAVLGLAFNFYVGAAVQLRIDPNGSETIALPSSGAQGAAGKYLVADAVGEWVNLRCLIAGQWAVVGYAGTWTAEA